MNYKNFKYKIYNYLGDYKTTKLNIFDDGVYKGKKYRHILPLGNDNELALKNYLCEEAIDETSKVEFKRHDYWMHLNSSQTLCVNYFIKLIINNYYGLNKILSKYLKQEVKIIDHQFECVIKEKSTNFDFYCEDINNHKYYFEIKYTEDGFEKKTKAKNPEKEFNDTYKKLILEGTYLKDNKGNININCCEFMCKHYQCYRNIIMANEEKGNFCFFITMRANGSTYKELAEIVKPEYKNVKVIYWEDLIPNTVGLFKNESELAEYYKKVKEKYIPENL